MHQGITSRMVWLSMIAGILFGIFLVNIQAQEITIRENPNRDVSLKNEVKHAIEKGLDWFKKNQNENGYWSQEAYPALTALVLTAFMGDPEGTYKSGEDPIIKKGFDYLKRYIKPDGGIYGKDLASYNTAVSIMAFQAASDPAYLPILKNARNFLIGLQGDFDIKGKIDSPYDGGVGYGDKYNHSDMSNTSFALEAIYYTKYLDDLPDANKELKKLDWAAAIKFIERCQHLPGTNDQPWASDDPQNKGGFIYFPGDSKAGEMQLPNGKTALRSYGSISYAGLLSYAYADLKKDDPRVTAVYEWLQKNYTLDENPGMGEEGLFYYYHLMAKALSILNIDEIQLANGQKVNWRTDLAKKLLNLQSPEGFWANDNGRWWEKDPVLVTSYATIAMEIIYRGL